MSDDKPGRPRPDDETQPAPASASYEPGVAQPVARRGFRDRLRSLRRSDGSRPFGLAALVASALAGVIVGGVGTTVFHAATDDHDRGRWMERHDLDGDGGSGGWGGVRGGPPGMPGQLPPSIAPGDEGSSG